MINDNFEFNYKKERKKKIVLSDEQTEIIIKIVFFALLAIGLIGIGIFSPIYIDIYCWSIGTLFVLYLMVVALVDITGSSVLRAVFIILVIGYTLGISHLSNMVFMYHNLRTGGKEFIQKIDRAGNSSILIISKDSKNKRKKFIIDNSDYTITSIHGHKEYLIKKDGKYILYVNNQISNQIKDIKIVQQESIKQEEIKQVSNKNEDEGVDFYFLIGIVIILFIIFGFKKL